MPGFRLLTGCAVVALVATVLSCGSSLADSEQRDAKAEKQVQQYFAGKGARYVVGLDVEDISVTNDSDGQRLSVRFVSNQPSQGNTPFLSLYYESVSPEGWIADLNATGLNLAWAEMVFDYGDELPDTLRVDVARHDIAGSTRVRSGPTN